MHLFCVLRKMLMQNISSLPLIILVHRNNTYRNKEETKKWISAKKDIRCRQDSNLRGETPMDF